MKNILKRTAAQTAKFSYFFICFWVIFSIDAHAYIDPSAVTYIVQAVAAVFIALGAAATVFRHKIFAFFRKNSKKSEKREIHIKDDNEESAEDDK